MCGGIGAALLLPAVQAAREAARRAQCSNNLKQIALALHVYHDIYQSLPPAYIADANGKPMHSWRVLILPYMDAEELYKQYRFDEPWDGPHNSQLAAKMPPAFQCPSEPAGSPETHYMVVVGEGAIFDGDQPPKFSDVTDSLSNTIMVVESSTSTNWLAPVDLSFSQMSFTINDASKPAIGSKHAGGVNVARADAAVFYLRPPVPPETLRAWLTRAGGEKVPPPGN